MTESAVSRAITPTAQSTKRSAVSSPSYSMFQAVVTASVRPTAVGSSAPRREQQVAGKPASGRTIAKVRSSSLTSSRSASAPAGTAVRSPATVTSIVLDGRSPSPSSA